MSLDNILLGILKKPAAGYDIKQHFEQVFRHFWSADLAQIYRSLNRLEKDGLLESRTEPSDKGPERKVYRRTAAGTKALHEWLRAGPVFGSEKFTYLAQVFFLGEPGDHALGREFLTKLHEELATQLATLQAIEQGWRSEAGDNLPDSLQDEDFYAWLTLDMGLRKTRALVEWADNAIMKLEQRQTGERGNEQ